MLETWFLEIYDCFGGKTLGLRGFLCIWIVIILFLFKVGFVLGYCFGIVCVCVVGILCFVWFGDKIWWLVGVCLLVWRLDVDWFGLV